MSKSQRQLVELLLSQCHSLLGPLTDDCRDRLLAFYDNPSKQTWDAAYSINLLGIRTAWQAWSAVDPQAPESLPTYEGWDRWSSIPSRDTFVQMLEYLVAPGLMAMASSREKVQLLKRVAARK